MTPKLQEVRAIVTAWRNGTGTELTAARAMYELACLLEIDPPKPVAGRVRRPEHPNENRHAKT